MYRGVTHRPSCLAVFSYIAVERRCGVYAESSPTEHTDHLTSQRRERPYINDG